jgi:acyl-CoA thioesterase I
MNKRLIFLLLLLAACHRKEDKSQSLIPSSNIPPQSSVTVIALGDSLTYGLWLPDRATQAYPVLLERDLRARGHSVTVVNEGVSGHTTAHGLARLDSVLSRGGDIVIVALGSNDAINQVGLSTIEHNLNDLVQRIKAKGMDPVLCALKTFPTFDPGYVSGFQDIFPRVAQQNNILLTPFMLEGVFLNPAMNVADGIHPNVEGTERVAANLLPTVEEAVRRREASR